MRRLAACGLGRTCTLGLCLLVVACRAVAPASQPASLGPALPANLLRNGSFLQDTSSWETVPHPLPPSITLAHDQAGFVTLAVAATTEPLTVGWTQTVPVSPGTAYRASYRVRTEKLVGEADLRLSFLDAEGRLVYETGVLAASGDTGWATCAWRGRAPATATQIRVTLGVVGATGGRAAFDDPCLLPDDAPQTRALIVDYQQEAGTLRTFAQMSGPPGAAARTLGIESVRTHGFSGPADMHTLFPNPAADPNDPASYDFAATDRALATIVESGARVFFRQTPRRLAAQGGDELGFALLAGKSDDGRVAHILIADTGSRSQEYRLALAGFPPGMRYTVTEIAQGCRATVVAKGHVGRLPDGVLTMPWHSPAVHFIELGLEH